MTSIQTIQQLYTSILADLQTEFGFLVSAFGKAKLRAYAMVHATGLKLVYLAIGKLQNNIFADTCDAETLLRFGKVKLGRLPFPATQGQYEITVTVALPSPAIISIPAGTVFKSDDDALNPGKLYILDISTVVDYPTDTIIVRALEAGTDSELIVGDTLTATAPIANAGTDAAVAAETVAPTAAETTEEYRKKVLESFRLYPQGGASADYRLWGKDAAGVKQIYPYTASGAPNEVNVFVEATIAASTDSMGTPTGTILTDVAAAIEADPVTGQGRRPLGVFAVNTQAVVINQIVITIPGASTISAANRTLITAALTSAVDAVRPFIAGTDTLAERNDYWSINSIIAAILSTVPGSIFSTPTMTIQVGAGSPASQTSKTFDLGNIPFLSTVTYA